MNAAVLAGLDYLDRRWTLHLLHCVHTLQPCSYAVIRHELPGPSPSVLAARLRSLTDDHLLTRTVAAGPPVSVTYTLGTRGAQLLPWLEQVSAVTATAVVAATTATTPQSPATP